jgi:hypothetical protein
MTAIAKSAVTSANRGEGTLARWLLQRRWQSGLPRADLDHQFNDGLEQRGSSNGERRSINDQL